MRDQFPDVELRVYATMDEAYLDLSSGRVDAIIGDVVALSESFLTKPGGEGFEFRGPNFTDPQWFGYGAGEGVRKEDQGLGDALSTAIDKIRKEGKYETIDGRWLDFDQIGRAPVRERWYQYA